ncbi:HAD family hydrolase [soil metagenome]
MAIKGILFDKDGTLIDVTGTWVPAYHEVLGELFGRDAEKIEAMLVAAGYDPAKSNFTSGSILASGTTRELVNVWWPGLDQEDVLEKLHLLDVEYRDVALKHLKSLMPLEPILSALRTRGLRLGVATNDTQGSALSHLTELGAAMLFDAVIGADSVTVPKPSGDMVRKFAEITGLAPAEIALVGDNPHDIAEARNGGAGLAIGVLSGNSRHDDLEPIADHIIPSIAHLDALLAEIGR